MINKITPEYRGLGPKVRELWRSRGLIRLLVVRDLRIRYAQTLVGILWAVFNPIVNLLILYLVFHRIADVATNGVPPLLYTAVGLLGWTYFAEAVSQGGDSLIGSQNLVKRVYFPRLVLPLSKAALGLVELGINLVLILVLFLFYGYAPGPWIWLFPFFLFLVLLSGITAGIWISALTIRYRDFRFVIPTLLRVGMFVTPIAFSASEIAANWQWLYFLNPVAGIVEGIKWTLLGGAPLPLEATGGLVLLVVLFVWGSHYFSKVEEIVADWI